MIRRPGLTTTTTTKLADDDLGAGRHDDVWRLANVDLASKPTTSTAKPTADDDDDGGAR